MTQWAAGTQIGSYEIVGLLGMAAWARCFAFAT